MKRLLLAVLFAPLLLSCGSGSAHLLRFVDCTRTAYCTPLPEWPNPSWSAQHEALYAQGVRSIVHEMACGKMMTRGRRFAYVSPKDLAAACGSASASVQVHDREQGNRLLAAGTIDYVVEFERANAANVRGGVQVPLSAVYYGKARRTGGESRLEGMDNYLIVQADGATELRLVSRSARD